MTADPIIPFQKPRLSHMIEVLGFSEIAQEFKDALSPTGVLPNMPLMDYPIYIGPDFLDYGGYGVTYLNIESGTVGSALEMTDMRTLASYAIKLVEKGIITDVYIVGMVRKEDPSHVSDPFTSVSDDSFGLGPEFDSLGEKMLAPDQRATMYDDNPAYHLAQSVFGLTHDYAAAVNYLVSAALNVIYDHCPLDGQIDPQKTSYNVKLALLNAFKNQVE